MGLFLPPFVDDGTGNTDGGGPIVGVGMLRQRGAVNRVASPTSTFSSLTSVLSFSFAALYDDSIIEVTGEIVHSNNNSASNDNDGFLIYLYVDGADSGETPFADWTVQTNWVGGKTFCFQFTPGDTASHTISIRCSQATGTAIVARDSWARAMEYAPNQS